MHQHARTMHALPTCMHHACTAGVVVAKCGRQAWHTRSKTCCVASAGIHAATDGLCMKRSMGCNVPDPSSFPSLLLCKLRSSDPRFVVQVANAACNGFVRPDRAVATPTLSVRAKGGSAAFFLCRLSFLRLAAFASRTWVCGERYASALASLPCSSMQVAGRKQLHPLSVEINCASAQGCCVVIRSERGRETDQEG